MIVDSRTIDALLTPQKVQQLFPEERTDQFFEALFGDATEGAYTIRLAYAGCDDHQLNFNLELVQRPGRCLACNLTYGLPTVFARHPIIDIQGVVQQINTLLQGHARCEKWQLGATREISPQLHLVPLTIELE